MNATTHEKNSEDSTGQNKAVGIIQINTVIDVVGVLADDSLQDNIYLIDNNKKLGSKNQSTDHLHTAVKVDDEIFWSVESLEPEAYGMVSQVEIDPNFVETTVKTFPGSDVLYIYGKVKQKFEHLNYNLVVNVGTENKTLTSSTDLALFCVE